MVRHANVQVKSVGKDCSDRGVYALVQVREKEQHAILPSASQGGKPGSLNPRAERKPLRTASAGCSKEGRHFAVYLFVHTNAKGRSIFSRSTENGPAFP